MFYNINLRYRILLAAASLCFGEENALKYALCISYQTSRLNNLFYKVMFCY